MSNLQTAYQYFVSQGDSSAASAGIAAGLQAESALNPTAYNPSGATGIAQWLGGRLQALENLFGSSPSFQQQLQFVQDELTGAAADGNQGGSTILADTSPAQALNDFINLFERPLPGPQTTGDIQRGTSALATLNMSGTPTAGSASLGIGTTSPQSVTGDTGALGNFELGLNTLFTNPGLFTSTLFSGAVTPQSIVTQGVQATGQMGVKGAGEASNAIAGQVAAGVGAAVAPLTSWLTGLTSGATVTRVSIGVVAVILLAAGIFFLAGNKQITLNMTGQRALA